MLGKKVSWGSYWEYTPTGVSLAKAAGCFFTDVTEVKPADVLWFYYTSLGRVGHTGIVKTAQVSGSTLSITTVEGNTSSIDYDRSGGCVREKSYTVKQSQIGGTNSIYGFAHPNYCDLCTAEELVSVASAEEGYQEKASASQLDDPTANIGSNNYTKYGAWYGDNGQPWCAQFVSWCIEQACIAHAEEPAKGWVEVNGGWQYIEDGVAVANAWREITGRWYVFDGAGYMITGWFLGDKTNWYYLGDDGAMLSSQWVEVAGDWYYLTESGALATTAFIRSGATYFYVDEDGRWDSSKDACVLAIYEQSTGCAVTNS